MSVQNILFFYPLPKEYKKYTELHKKSTKKCTPATSKQLKSTPTASTSTASMPMKSTPKKEPQLFITYESYQDLMYPIQA